jgi:glutaredoxin
MSKVEVRCVEKVKKHNDKLVIFYSDWCPYSRSAIDFAKKKKLDYRAYDIDSITDGFNIIRNLFISKKNEINFNPEHKTRPMIFYKGKFIGGYNETIKLL